MASDEEKFNTIKGSIVSFLNDRPQSREEVVAALKREKVAKFGSVMDEEPTDQIKNVLKYMWHMDMDEKSPDRGIKYLPRFWHGVKAVKNDDHRQQLASLLTESNDVQRWFGPDPDHLRNEIEMDGDENADVSDDGKREVIELDSAGVPIVSAKPWWMDPGLKEDIPWRIDHGLQAFIPHMDERCSLDKFSKKYGFTELRHRSPLEEYLSVSSDAVDIWVKRNGSVLFGNLGTVESLLPSDMTWKEYLRQGSSRVFYLRLVACANVVGIATVVLLPLGDKYNAYAVTPTELSREPLFLEVESNHCVKLVTAPKVHVRITRSSSWISVGTLPPLPVSRLVHLTLINVDDVKKFSALVDNVGFGLKSLNLMEVARLPGNIGQLTNLNELSIHWCRKLKELPDSFVQLTQLKKLKIWGTSISSFSNEFGQLNHLNELEIRSCKELEQLPNSFVQLKQLKKLKIYDTPISSLSNNFGQLINLIELEIDHCKQLKTLPDSFGQLKQLKILNISRCSISTLLDDFGHLTNLIEFGVVEERLTGLPDSFVQLMRLRKLKIHNTSISYLPHHFGQLNNLMELEISRCLFLNRLPDSFVQLKQLTKLIISDTSISSLSSLSDNLIELEIINCDKLTELPDSFGRLKQLKKLTIEGTSISSLSNEFGQLNHLTELEIINCMELKQLPDSFGALEILSKLIIKDVPIVELPRTICNLRHLSEIQVPENLYWPPPDIVKSGKLIEFLRQSSVVSSATTSRSPTRPSKLMLLGRGGVGKTTFVTALKIGADLNSEVIQRISAVRQLIENWNSTDVYNWIENDLLEGDCQQLSMHFRSNVDGRSLLNHSYDSVLSQLLPEKCWERVQSAISLLSPSINIDDEVHKRHKEYGSYYRILLDLPHVWTKQIDNFLLRLGHDSFEIWDFPGQMEFYPMHRFFCSKNNALQAVLLDGRYPEKCEDDVYFWLNGLKSAVQKDFYRRDDFENKYRMHVLFLISHGDCCQEKAEQTRILVESLIPTLSKLFGDVIIFSEVPNQKHHAIVIDYSTEQSFDNLRQNTKKLLLTCNTHPLIPAHFSVLKRCEKLPLEDLLMTKKEWSEFARKIEQFSDDDLQLLHMNLEFSGEILMFDSLLAIRPVSWVSVIMGSLLDPSLDGSKIRGAMDQTIVHQLFHRRLPEFESKMKEVLGLLAKCGLCVFSSRSNMWIFPTLLSRHPDTLPVSPFFADSLRLLGKKFVCSRIHERIPPGFMCALLIALYSQKHIYVQWMYSNSVLVHIADDSYAFIRLKHDHSSIFMACSGPAARYGIDIVTDIFCDVWQSFATIDLDIFILCNRCLVRQLEVSDFPCSVDCATIMKTIHTSNIFAHKIHSEFNVKDNIPCFDLRSNLAFVEEIYPESTSRCSVGLKEMNLPMMSGKSVGYSRNALFDALPRTESEKKFEHYYAQLMIAANRLCVVRTETKVICLGIQLTEDLIAAFADLRVDSAHDISFASDSHVVQWHFVSVVEGKSFPIGDVTLVRLPFSRPVAQLEVCNKSEPSPDDNYCDIDIEDSQSFRKRCFWNHLPDVSKRKQYVIAFTRDWRWKYVGRLPVRNEDSVLSIHLLLEFAQQDSAPLDRKLSVFFGVSGLMPKVHYILVKTDGVYYFSFSPRNFDQYVREGTRNHALFFHGKRVEKSAWLADYMISSDSRDVIGLKGAHYVSEEKVAIHLQKQKGNQSTRQLLILQDMNTVNLSQLSQNERSCLEIIAQNRLDLLRLFQCIQNQRVDVNQTVCSDEELGVYKMSSPLFGDFVALFVADTGDGWASTRRVAEAIHGEEAHRLLFHGGDLYYPMPDRDGFVHRFENPYRKTPKQIDRKAMVDWWSPRNIGVLFNHMFAGRFGHHPGGDYRATQALQERSLSNRERLHGVSFARQYALNEKDWSAMKMRPHHPKMFIVAGNHDWLDGLSLYDRFILRSRTFADHWDLPQKRSYWAVEACGWLFFGIDDQVAVGNSADIDHAQLEYFCRILHAPRRTGPDQLERRFKRHQVVFMMHRPFWLLMEKGGERFSLLLRETNGCTAGVKLMLAGDLHFTMHHAPKFPDAGVPHLLVCGSGGAFLHSTSPYVGLNPLPFQLNLPEMIIDSEHTEGTWWQSVFQGRQTGFESPYNCSLQFSYPNNSESNKLPFRYCYRIFGNWAYCLMYSVFGLFFTWSFQWPVNRFNWWQYCGWPLVWITSGPIINVLGPQFAEHGLSVLIPSIKTPIRLIALLCGCLCNLLLLTVINPTANKAFFFSMFPILSDWPSVMLKLVGLSIWFGIVGPFFSVLTNGIVHCFFPCYCGADSLFSLLRLETHKAFVKMSFDQKTKKNSWHLSVKVMAVNSKEDVKCIHSIDIE